MDEETELLRNQASQLLREIGDTSPELNSTVSIILDMQICNDSDVLVVLGTRAVGKLQILRASLSTVQYDILIKAIISVAETEEERISRIDIVETLH